VSIKIENEVYKDHPDGIVREKLNCPFYPACYWTGDCNLDDWKHSNCGLPKNEKQKRRDKWMDGIKLRSSRFKLGEKLKSLAATGKLDDLLGEVD
jgi:hypothetical protein